MKRLFAALLASSALVFEPAAHASLVILLGLAGGGSGGGGGGGRGGGGVALPVNTFNPEVIGLDYPNDGASTAVTGTTLTLNAKAGQWDNAPTGHSYSWHKPDGTVLGSGPTLTLDTSNAGVVGTVVEVDDVAANAAGSATATSHWFGPI
jgi:hypothetical protein